jgi:regulator of sigma D
MEDGEPKDGKQTVRTSAVIVVPTNSLIQFCQTFVDNMSKGADQMLEANNNLRKVIEGLKAKVPASKQ